MDHKETQTVEGNEEPKAGNKKASAILISQSLEEQF
jgi:hypothetical protein